METIEFAGVAFVKVTVLAKKYRYTTDYIGQLCRSGKVEAKLVGRAWFVNEESLVNHKSDRYGATRTAEITIHKSLHSDRSEQSVIARREVHPTLSKVTARSLGAHMSERHEFSSQNGPRISVYHKDTDDLKPVGTAKVRDLKLAPEQWGDQAIPLPQKVNIVLAEKAVHNLPFDHTPEILLQGVLPVLSLDEASLYADTEPVTKLQMVSRPPEQLKEMTYPNVSVTRRYQTVHKAPVLAKSHTNQEKQVLESNVSKTTPNLESVPNSKIIPEQFSPNQTVVEFRPKLVGAPKSKSKVSFVVVPIFVGVAMIVCASIFSLTSFVESDGTVLKQSVKFNPVGTLIVWSKLGISY